MVEQASVVEALPLLEVERACQRETLRYRHSEPSDPRFCLEIFRRALRLSTAAGDAGPPVYADEEARATLVRIYSDFIKAQINRSALQGAPMEDLVQQAWLRFWRAANHGLSFPTLAAALAYLKQTTLSMLFEHQRQERRRRREASLQQLATATGNELRASDDADLFPQHARRRFQARCQEMLTDGLARRVFWMRFGMALPPREIARLLAGEGVPINGRAATARGVSDLIEHCCRLLERDPEIRALLESG
jgi:RNA polymerase sigma factor (sigma-70 family)